MITTPEPSESTSLTLSESLEYKLSTRKAESPAGKAARRGCAVELPEPGGRHALLLEAWGTCTLDAGTGRACCVPDELGRGSRPEVEELRPMGFDGRGLTPIEFAPAAMSCSRRLHIRVPPSVTR